MVYLSPQVGLPLAPPSPLTSQRHDLALPEFMRIRGNLVPSRGVGPPPTPPLEPLHGKYPHPLAVPSSPTCQHQGDNGLVPATQPFPTYDAFSFVKPPTGRRVIFSASSQSLAQLSHSPAFGFSLVASPSPSPQWKFSPASEPPHLPQITQVSALTPLPQDLALPAALLLPPAPKWTSPAVAPLRHPIHKGPGKRMDACNCSIST